ncbi:hypothetical protein ELUMI_v1c05240 [Williamsoniiplasma luminosum]|uniref:Uncharacterized protein n=1 Tax=Williamsoniiplasma luminosum TaxID=214888 RepID=A0A2K8NVP1_9MOLU|nr:hypothetical protein [Williamsoniiplasma luminosum]ATZ17248.1 hypothetical protein ELUMI_v1c05240 [Williamsoniiplasma luminosum]
MNKCQKKGCSIFFDYTPNDGYLIARGKNLKICDECHKKELDLRSKKLYLGSNRKVEKQISELINIVDQQTKLLTKLLNNGILRDK